MQLNNNCFKIHEPQQNKFRITTEMLDSLQDFKWKQVTPYKALHFKSIYNITGHIGEIYVEIPDKSLFFIHKS